MPNLKMLPRIHVISTGGTILSSTSEFTQTVSGMIADFSVGDLLRSVHGIERYADLSTEEIFRIESAELSTENLVTLSNAVNIALAKDAIDGVVIIHGTDTLEETAFFLHMTIKSKKPVVVVGAMRPAGAISADGPINFFNAVLSAADPESYGRGVIVCMNDRLQCARDVLKISTYNTDAFRCVEYGILGSVVGTHVRYFYAPTRPHTADTEFDVRDLATLPRVEIVYAYIGCQDYMFKSALAMGCQGIVIAGCGDGNYPALIDKYRKANINTPILVRSSRTGTGPISPGAVPDEERDTIPGGTFAPQKARLLLQLCLQKTTNTTEIREIFERY